jgi:hypothetical protein
MKKRLVFWYGTVIALAVLLISCAGTALTSKEVNKAYKGKPVSDILIIAITGNEDSRRNYERMFVKRLQSLGLEAIASLDVMEMPADLELKKDAILETVDKYENDGVIITHLKGKEEKEVYSRGEPVLQSYFGYYQTWHRIAYTPGYSGSRSILQLETNLFNVKSEALMWSGQSETWNKDRTKEIIRDVIDLVVKDLEKNGLIAPK